MTKCISETIATIDLSDVVGGSFRSGSNAVWLTLTLTDAAPCDGKGDSKPDNGKPVSRAPQDDARVSRFSYDVTSPTARARTHQQTHAALLLKRASHSRTLETGAHPVSRIDVHVLH